MVKLKGFNCIRELEKDVDYFFATFIDFPNNILSIFVSLHREFVKHLMQINEKFHNVCMQHFIVLVGGKLWKR